jgi:hypothetical protein
VLRTRDGRAYFANLLTRETRWLPPHLWMRGWVSRLEIDSASPASADIGSMSQALSSGGRNLPCDCRTGRCPLPILSSVVSVLSAALRIHVRACPWRASVPTRRALGLAAHVSAGGQLCTLAASLYAGSPTGSTALDRLGAGAPRDAGSHEVCHRLWLTIAAADAADAREAFKPHRASDAVRQPSVVLILPSQEAACR